jgi:hypothetical protein
LQSAFGGATVIVVAGGSDLVVVVVAEAVAVATPPTLGPFPGLVLVDDGSGGSPSSTAREVAIGGGATAGSAEETDGGMLADGTDTVGADSVAARAGASGVCGFCNSKNATTPNAVRTDTAPTTIAAYRAADPFRAAGIPPVIMTSVSGCDGGKGS